MAQLFDIKRVTIGPRALAAVVEVASDAPLMTSEDISATARVFDLMPGIADHTCLGDASPSFRDVVADTEIAHLLEHVTVELLAQTDVAGDVTAGKTVGVGERTYEITISCMDDVLVAGALSSAAWIMQWAYAGGGDPRPDIEAIVDGLVALVASLDQPPAEDAAGVAPEQGQELVEAVEEPEPEAPAEPEQLTLDQALPEPPVDPAPASEPAPSPEGPAAPEPAPAQPARDDWGMDDVPRPRLVR